jgi:hypothetical protein
MFFIGQTDGRSTQYYSSEPHNTQSFFHKKNKGLDTYIRPDLQRRLEAIRRLIILARQMKQHAQATLQTRVDAAAGAERLAHRPQEHLLQVDEVGRVHHARRRGPEEGRVGRVACGVRVRVRVRQQAGGVIYKMM